MPSPGTICSLLLLSVLWVDLAMAGSSFLSPEHQKAQQRKESKKPPAKLQPRELEGWLRPEDGNREEGAEDELEIRLLVTGNHLTDCQVGKTVHSVQKEKKRKLRKKELSSRKSSTPPLMLESSCQGLSPTGMARPWGSFFRTCFGKKPMKPLNFPLIKEAIGSTLQPAKYFCHQHGIT